MKRVLLSFLLILSFSFPSFAATVIYENRSETVLGKNLTYELNRQITDEGMLDIHVITVPLSNPHMYVGPVTSAKDLGLKESALNMLADADALAGVNGDFFGMTGLYSVPFGPVIADGQVQSISATTNQNKSEFAAFILNPDNSAMMKYLRAEIHFYNNGVENIEIGTYNKVGLELEWPVIIDRQYMPDTSGLDARFAGLWKIVVSNRAISYLSQFNETVEIPEDGYVVVIPARLYESYRYKLNVGDSAAFNLGNNIGVSLTNLKSAIGGGGLILSAGNVVHDSGTVIAGRQPRTAVGVSQDGSKLILMTVDGRTHSIGATHDELAALLLRYGAWDAMHLDGGGSSTMVYKEPESGGYTVANTPSDGAQRRVINTLGVFDRSPQGGAVQLDVFLSQSKVFAGTSVVAEAIGRDLYGHRAELPADIPSTIYAEPADGGSWNGNLYTPHKAGLQTVQVLRDGKNAWQYLWVYDIAEVICDTGQIRTLPGISVPLNFNGIATDGTEVPADYGVQVKVIPENLGVWENGQFTAGNTGTGFLECTVGGASTYVSVTVGGFANPLNVFNVNNTKFEGYPVGVSGSVYTEPLADTGATVTRFQYYFPQSGATQAAYMVFDPPVILPDDPMALSLKVMGDGSGHWLRGRVTDAAGREFTVDFERSLDSMDWEKLTAIIPEEAQAPMVLNRVYFAATENPSKTTSLAYFDGLEALYAPEHTVAIPQGQKFTDPMRAPQPAPADAVPLAIPAPGEGAYSAEKVGNMAVIRVSAAEGGIYATDKSQWAKFAPDIENLMPEAVVVLMDFNPLEFKQKKELELLQTILSYQRNARLHPVFVISATGETAGGETAALTMNEGVRYINFAQGTESVKVWEDAGKFYWGE